MTKFLYPGFVAPLPDGPTAVALLDTPPEAPCQLVVDPGLRPLIDRPGREPAALHRHINSGDRWIEPSVDSGWAISLRPEARGTEVQRFVPTILKLEGMGERRIEPSDRDHAPTWSQQLFQLG